MSKNLSWSLTQAPQIYTVGNTQTFTVVATDYGWTRVLGLTGTANSTGVNVTGTGTKFTTELAVGRKIVVGAQIRTVATIADDTHLTTTTAFNPVLSGATILRLEEVLVGLSELLAKKADAAGVPTFTLAVPANATYGTGQVLTFTVTPSEAVEVTNTPRIQLTIGAATKYALYDAAASTDTSMVFKYTVVAGDASGGGGITVANTINLNTTGKVKDKIAIGGAVIDVASGALTFTVPATTGIIVTGV